MLYCTRQNIVNMLKIPLCIANHRKATHQYTHMYEHMSIEQRQIKRENIEVLLCNEALQNASTEQAEKSKYRADWKAQTQRLGLTACVHTVKSASRTALPTRQDLSLERAAFPQRGRVAQFHFTHTEQGACSLKQ